MKPARLAIRLTLERETCQRLANSLGEKNELWGLLSEGEVIGDSLLWFGACEGDVLFDVGLVEVLFIPEAGYGGGVFVEVFFEIREADGCSPAEQAVGPTGEEVLGIGGAVGGEIAFEFDQGAEAFGTVLHGLPPGVYGAAGGVAAVAEARLSAILA